jgi:hypothetical protein
VNVGSVVTSTKNRIESPLLAWGLSDRFRWLRDIVHSHSRASTISTCVTTISICVTTIIIPKKKSSHGTSVSIRWTTISIRATTISICVTTTQTIYTPIHRFCASDLVENTRIQGTQEGTGTISAVIIAIRPLVAVIALRTLAILLNIAILPNTPTVTLVILLLDTQNVRLLILLLMLLLMLLLILLLILLTPRK